MSARIITKAMMPEIVQNMVSDYQDKNFYGKVTLFFEAGKVTDIRAEEAIRPDDLHDRYSKPRKKITVSLKRDGSGDDVTKD